MCFPGVNVGRLICVFCWNLKCIFLCNPPLWLCISVFHSTSILYSVDLVFSVLGGYALSIM